jgi:hypothetical protein
MVTFAIEGLTQLQRLLHSIPQEVESRQRAVTHQAVILLQDEARGRIHSPRGEARRGIESTVTGGDPDITGTVRAATKAARFSIRGRRPGRPPIAPTVIRFANVSRATAFLIGRAIGRHGVKGHPVMERALAARKAQLKEMFLEGLRQAIRIGRGL